MIYSPGTDQQAEDLRITYRNPSELIPYTNNAKHHGQRQVDAVAASISKFGFLNPILLDGGDGVVAGHCRLMAAMALGLDRVPTIEISHLSGDLKRAYIIADNRLAELDSGWDMAVLKLEAESIFAGGGVDLALTGFTLDDFDLNADAVEMPGVEMQPLQEDGMELPDFEPVDVCHDLGALIDTDRYFELIREIERAGLTRDVAGFLKLAATRHIVFNPAPIADYYANAPEYVKGLMRESALVLHDQAGSVLE